MIKYWQKVIVLEVNSQIVLLSFIWALPSSDQFSNISPVPKSKSSLNASLLLKPLEKEKLFLSSPLPLEKREVELIDDMITLGERMRIGKTTETVIEIVAEYFSMGWNIPSAIVALNFVWRVHDILSLKIEYVVALALFSLSQRGGLRSLEFTGHFWRVWTHGFPEKERSYIEGELAFV